MNHIELNIAGNTSHYNNIVKKTTIQDVGGRFTMFIEGELVFAPLNYKIVINNIIYGFVRSTDGFTIDGGNNVFHRQIYVRKIP